MENFKYQSEQLTTATTPNLQTIFPPLETVNRPTVPTDQAAYYLNRQPQTLRSWASLQPTGVIRPIRINGRLAWNVAEIKALLSGDGV